MEKKFEKLDMDFLGATFDDGVIPEVESIQNVEPVVKKPSNPNLEDTEDTEDNDTVGLVDSITDLEVDDDDDTNPTDPVKPAANNDNTGGVEDNEVLGLAKFFSSKGYLEFDEDKDKDITEEWLEDNIEKTLQKRAEEILDPTIKYINDLYKKGIPLETLLVAQSDKDSLESIDNEELGKDEKLAESVVRKYYLEVLESDEDEISSTIEDLKDAGMLGKQAVKMKEKILKHNERQLAIKEKELEREAALEKSREQERLVVLKKVVDSSKTFINGIDMSTAEKDKLFSGITKKDRQGLTEYQKKLMDPDMQLKVAQFILLYNGDLAPLEEKIKTNVVKNIKTKANTYTQKAPKDPQKIANEALRFIKSSLKNK